MGKIITIFNLKNSSGKTTVAINLAKIFATRGRTLLIDLDPIGNASKYFGIKNNKYSIADILSKNRDFPEVVNRCTVSELFILPANLKLISWIVNQKNENYINGFSSVLEYLNSKFETIIIDTSSSSQFLINNKLLAIAVKSSNKIIVPVKVDSSSIYFLKKSLEYLEQNNKIPDILPTMYRDENIEIYKNIIKNFGNLMMKIGSNGIKIDDGIGSSFGFQQLAISSSLNF